MRYGLGLAWVFCMVMPCIGQAASSSAAESAPVRLSLQGAIDAALREATQVAKAGNDERAAAAQMLQGYAQFLPDLNAGVDYGYRSGTTLYTINGLSSVYARSQRADFTLSSVFNLFNGLGDLANLDSAIERHRASDLDLGFARKQIALDVTQAYLQETLDRELFEIARKNLQASDARLRQLRGRYEVGQASPADLQREEAQRAADEQAVAAADLKAHDDLLALVRRLRMDPARAYELEAPDLRVKAGPGSPAMAAAMPDGELIRAALEKRQDFAASQALSAATSYEVQRARAPYFPRLDLLLTRAAAGTHLLEQRLNGVNVLPATQSDLVPQLGSQVEYAATLSLSWNLFNRLIDKTAVERARLAADNQRIDEDDLRLRVAADVRQAKKAFAVAGSQLAAARVGVRAAEAAFKTIEGRYRVGASSFIDLLTAQSALASARASQAQAAYNLKYQEKALAFVLGD
jgi:outer membrane protein